MTNLLLYIQSETDVMMSLVVFEHRSIQSPCWSAKDPVNVYLLEQNVYILPKTGVMMSLIVFEHSSI